MQRSRLTRSPVFRVPRPVRRSVSPMTSAVKSPGRCSVGRLVEVRQTPLTANEPPSSRSVTREPASMVIAAESFVYSMDSTVPSPSMIPVNM